MDHYWHSGLPARTLRFGEYLYYSGRISWMQLIRALVWQAGQRPRFGQLAEQLGYLTPGTVTESLSHRRPDERIGEAALRMHLMSALQHQVVLLAQTSGRRRIGDFFLESRALHPFDIEDTLPFAGALAGRPAQARRKLQDRVSAVRGNQGLHADEARACSFLEVPPLSLPDCHARI